jgi:hypothetical protein
MDRYKLISEYYIINSLHLYNSRNNGGAKPIIRKTFFAEESKIESK